MRRLLRHRYALGVPFALLALVTLVGGQLNTVDARGRVVDDTSDGPVANVPVTYGSRVAVSAEDGSYVMTSLPRGARLQAQKSGYSRSFAQAEATELRLVPLTLTLEVKDETTGKGVDSPEARQNEKPIGGVGGRGSATGELAIGPYPVRDLPLLVCAKGYESKSVLPKGVLLEVTLKPGGAGCPPLPTPSPTVAPSVSPSPSASPAASPSPATSPTASPTPAVSPSP